MRKIVLLLFVFAIGCSKDSDTINPVNDDPEVDIWTVNKPDQYALNIVYFKPTDMTVDDVLLKELSDMMLFIQKWYAKQMEHNGFGAKTFGLITNQHGEAKIIVVNGKESSDYYNGNGNLIKGEINDYYASHPSEKHSDHTFVLGKQGSGVPFYGLGKFAFATSTNFKLTSSGKFLDELELMNCDKLGGIMHELGHGINLPHNAHKGSDLPNIALMSFGNHTYQQGKTDQVFLTKASCAILDVSQTFNKKTKTYYNGSANVELGTFVIDKDDASNAISVNGILTSDMNPTFMYIGHNGYPHNGSNNAAYDKVTFTESLNALGNSEYEFSFLMSYEDLFNGYKDNEKDRSEFSMTVIFENGNKKTIYSYDYTMDLDNKVPNDDIKREYIPFELSDRSSWTATVNSTGPGSDKKNMLDSDKNSYWHSGWQYNIAEQGAHEIVLDFKENKACNGVYLLSERPGTQYRPKQIEVFKSDDGNDWSELQSFTIGSMSDARELKLEFENAVEASFIKLKIKEVFSGNTEENLIITEIDYY